MCVLGARVTRPSSRSTDPAPERGSAGKGGCPRVARGLSGWMLREVPDPLRQTGTRAPALRGWDVRGAAYPNAVLLERGGDPWRSLETVRSSQRRGLAGCFWHPVGRDRGAADPPTRRRSAPSRGRAGAQVSGADDGGRRRRLEGPKSGQDPRPGPRTGPNQDALAAPHLPRAPPLHPLKPPRFTPSRDDH